MYILYILYIILYNVHTLHTVHTVSAPLNLLPHTLLFPDEAAEVEADEMLTINAQNLMKSVRDTVRASEACSVKMLSNPNNNLQFRRKR